MKRILLVLITTLTIIVACDSNNESPTTANKDFYKNYYQDNILNSITKLKEETEQLKKLILTFQTSTSDANYKEITAQWLTTAKAYSKAELYNFGLIKEHFFNENIYNFPINVNKIESNISEESIYNTAYFNSKSTVTKGLSTVEYLLYGNDFNTENAKNNLINNPYRINYLLGVVNDILRQSNLIISTWQNGYSIDYSNANADLCTENAKCLTINQIINVLDIARVTKIGKPAGFEKSKNPNPKTLQAYRSKKSLLLIKAMLEEVKYVYFNSNTAIATLVDDINTSKEISTQIKNKLTTLEQQISLLNNNLYDAINSNPQSVEAIYTSLKELTRLFSVDVTSTLSVVTLPTDNDGD